MTTWQCWHHGQLSCIKAEKQRQTVMNQEEPAETAALAPVKVLTDKVWLKNVSHVSVHPHQSERSLLPRQPTGGGHWLSTTQSLPWSWRSCNTNTQVINTWDTPSWHHQSSGTDSLRAVFSFCSENLEPSVRPDGPAAPPHTDTHTKTKTHRNTHTHTHTKAKLSNRLY